MRGASGLAIAGALALLATTANAADLPVAPTVVFSPWYLRADIGMTNQQVKRLDNILYVGNDIEPVGMEFDAGMLFGLGIGVQHNNWLRFDLTGEFRSNADFSGLDIVNGGSFNDEYTAKKREWLFLLNAYLDLGRWWYVTPFVGAGVGVSQITISNFTDICSSGCPGGSVAFADTASKWNFAWALHAGLAFQASNNLTFELAYRYTNLGDGITGDIVTSTGVNDFVNPMHFKDITSHDVKIGLRWICCDTATAPPLRKG